MKQAAIFWSGGKDCAMALHKVLQEGEYNVRYLVCTMNPGFDRVSMHGIRRSLAERQAEAIGITLKIMWVEAAPDNSAYEAALQDTFAELKAEGIEYIIYGDIFLEDLRLYRQQQLGKADLTGLYPLWKESTTQLSRQLTGLGFRALTCCISTAYLSEDYLGRELNGQFFNQLPAAADPCGENGEFHTFCFDGPIFKRPVPFQTGERKFVPLEIRSQTAVTEQGFWYLDLN